MLCTGQERPPGHSEFFGRELSPSLASCFLYTLMHQPTHYNPTIVCESPTTVHYSGCFTHCTPTMVCEAPTTVSYPLSR